MSRPRQQHPTDSSGYAMTNQRTANRGNPISGSGYPDSQQGRRVLHASIQSAEDAVARAAVLADLHRPGTGGAPTTGGRVPHKQVHTHSVRDLREDMSDDEEGKITRSSSRSPTVSSAASSPIRSPPSRSPSWRSFQRLRGWASDALPTVTLVVALGAFLCAAMTLSRPRAPPGGL